MNTRTYRGDKFDAVLSQIRSELGDDVVILRTTESGRSGVEIEVLVENVQTPEAQLESKFNLPHARSYTPNKQFKDLLENQGIRSSIIESILKLPSNPQQSVDRSVSDGLSKIVRFDPRIPVKRRVIAMVGATGVGKTTTIAKLAAKMQLAFGYRVGLIAADSYRVGAQFHLKQYAELINAPFRSVNPQRRLGEEVAAAIDSLKDCEIVLIDTEGCNPRQKERLEGLKLELGSIAQIEFVLVLPAPSNEIDLSASVTAFRPLGAQRVVISKLDESGFLGPVVNTVVGHRLIPAFFTTGQRVPDDIEPASSRRLGWMLSRTVH